MLKNRNVATTIILCLVTFGIYMLYWFWVTINALDTEGKKSNMQPIAQFLLMFFYVGLVLFGLNADANLNSIKEQRGLPKTENMILYVVLGLVPFGQLILIGLVQNEINQLASN